jgi:hypothetical protein
VYPNPIRDRNVFFHGICCIPCRVSSNPSCRSTESRRSIPSRNGYSVNHMGSVLGIPINSARVGFRDTVDSPIDSGNRAFDYRSGIYSGIMIGDTCSNSVSIPIMAIHPASNPLSGVAVWNYGTPITPGAPVANWNSVLAGAVSVNGDLLEFKSHTMTHVRVTRRIIIRWKSLRSEHGCMPE